MENVYDKVLIQEKNIYYNDTMQNSLFYRSDADAGKLISPVHIALVFIIICRYVLWFPECSIVRMYCYNENDYTFVYVLLLNESGYYGASHSNNFIG